jgi:hypothetical protein
VATSIKIIWLGLDGSPAIPDLSYGRAARFYPALAYPGPSEIVFGYIAPEDDYSIYVVRSSDNGQSWSERVRIAPGPARDVTLVTTNDGLLHAIWNYDPERRRYHGQQIGYAVSADTGRSWTAPTYLDPKQQVWKPAVVADREGNLHLIFQDGLFGPEPPRLRYTTRPAGGDWSRPTLLLGDTVGSRDPELIITNTGELALLFVLQLGMRGERRWWGSAVSFLRPGRDCVLSP